MNNHNCVTFCLYHTAMKTDLEKKMKQLRKKLRSHALSDEERKTLRDELDKCKELFKSKKEVN
jgi:cell shape-determining protein MreC